MEHRLLLNLKLLLSSSVLQAFTSSDNCIMSSTLATSNTAKKDFKVCFKDVEENKEPHKTAFANISYVLKKSSVYAISQLAHSQSFRRRILWAIVLIVGISGLIFQVYTFLTLYFQYPVIITLEVQSGKKLHFPAVTICNLNRMKSEYIPCLHKDMKKCLTQEKGEIFLNKYPTLKTAYDSNFENGGYQKEKYGSVKQQKIDLLKFYPNLSSSQRKLYGYQADELIISCTYNGEPCSHSNFTHCGSMQYGNCYTFNRRKWNEKPLKTKYTGPNSSGLELILDLKVATYTSLAPAIGARVIIHEPTVDPNPDDYGLNINPGEETSVAVEMNTIQRLPPPYRDQCRQYNPNDNSSSYEACEKQCIDNLSLMLCSCINPKSSSESSIPYCNLGDIKQEQCLKKVLDVKNKRNCDCPLPCLSTDHQLTLSTASWPPLHFKTRLRPTVQNNATKMNETFSASSDSQDKFGNDSINQSLPTVSPIHEMPYTPVQMNDKSERFTLEEVRENEAKVKVFFETLQVKSYKQEPMFQESELFSQLGGQMGLWLGLSLVAMFECVEGILHLIHFCMHKGSPEKMG